jgi:hypothetical protein
VQLYWKRLFVLLLTKEQGLTFFIKNDVSEFTPLSKGATWLYVLGVCELFLFDKRAWSPMNLPWNSWTFLSFPQKTSIALPDIQSNTIGEICPSIIPFLKFGRCHSTIIILYNLLTWWWSKLRNVGINKKNFKPCSWSLITQKSLLIKRG